MERVILHCDLNNFFASVTLLSNETLKNLPVAVGGSKENRHGIILAKNEIAKKFGVKTAEPIHEAVSKCPDLVILKPNYKEYNLYSEKARNIYRRYTDLIEPFGSVECWLEVTGSRLLFGDGETIAQRIRKEIKAELGITASVGVSFNKVFAKLGSDYKKPDAVTVISRENFKDIVWPMPVSDLLFVGKQTAARLASCGIFTVGDLAAADERTLVRMLGKNGREIKNYAMGLDDSPVLPDNAQGVPKSVGRSVTLPQDVTTPEEVWRVFLDLAEDIAGTLKDNNLAANGIAVHTRTNTLEVKEFSFSFSTPTAVAMTLAKRGMEIFEKNYFWHLPLRSVGIRAIHLVPLETATQCDMFGEWEEVKKTEEIDKKVYNIRKKFGDASIVRGTVLNTHTENKKKQS